MTFAEFCDAVECRYVLEITRRDELDLEDCEDMYPGLEDLEPEDLVLWVLERDMPDLVANYFPCPDFNADWAPEPAEA